MFRVQELDVTTDGLRLETRRRRVRVGEGWDGTVQVQRSHLVSPGVFSLRSRYSVSHNPNPSRPRYKVLRKEVLVRLVNSNVTPSVILHRSWRGFDVTESGDWRREKEWRSGVMLGVEIKTCRSRRPSQRSRKSVKRTFLSLVSHLIGFLVVLKEWRLLGEDCRGPPTTNFIEEDMDSK